jgi:hypothetical protein
VEISGIVANGFGNAAQESNDLMFDGSLDLANAHDLETSILFDARNRCLGHFTEAGETLRSQNLDVEPLLKTIFLGPDAAHFRPGVTRDHGVSAVLRITGRGAEMRLQHWELIFARLSRESGNPGSFDYITPVSLDARVRGHDELLWRDDVILCIKLLNL